MERDGRTLSQRDIKLILDGKGYVTAMSPELPNGAIAFTTEYGRAYAVDTDGLIGWQRKEGDVLDSAVRNLNARRGFRRFISDSAQDPYIKKVQSHFLDSIADQP